MDVSVCLIVKDEENLLEDCLASLKRLSAEIIVLDTGSLDNTVDIAKKYTDRIHNFTWCDDFSAARNYSVSLASFDWIIIIDADERLISLDKGKLFKLFKYPEKLGYIELENRESSPDSEQNIKTSLSRVFNRNYYEFKGAIHEQLVRKDGAQSEYYDTGLKLVHFGYSADIVAAKNKCERNRKLLIKELEKHDNDPYLYYKLGQTYIASDDKDYSKAIECFERAIELEKNTKYEYFFDLLRLYGYSLINAKEYSKAMTIEKYIPEFSNNPDFVFMLAHIYMNNAEFDKSIAMFKRCTGMTGEREFGVTGHLANYNLGVINECLGNSADAIKYYKRCKDYPPAKMRLNELTRKK